MMSFSFSYMLKQVAIFEFCAVHLAQCHNTMLGPPIKSAHGGRLAACGCEVYSVARGLRRFDLKVQLHMEDGENVPPRRTKTCTAMLCRADISPKSKASLTDLAEEGLPELPSCLRLYDLSPVRGSGLLYSEPGGTRVAVWN
jgi:hypothetical protein